MTAATNMPETTNDEAIRIYSPNGEVFDYLPVSARVKGFLETFGPNNGYRIESKSVDYLQYAQGRLALSIALANQGKLSDEQAKSLFDDKKVVFTCQLLDKENKIVAEASAVKQIVTLKDHEVGETSAFQRLMAKLGHGGEVFDHDESFDMAAQNLTKTKPALEPTISHNSNKNDDTEEKSHLSVVPASEQQTTQERVTAEQSPSEKSSRNSTGQNKVDSTVIQPAQLRQLERLAKLKCVEMPSVSSTEDVRRELKRLHDLPLPEA